jgi:hypothetical protein
VYDVYWELGRVGMARPDVGYRAVALLQLGIELTDRHSQLRPRFEHPGSRVDERQILVVGKLDQPVEHRVVEYFPPFVVLLVAGADRRVVGFEPFLSDWGRGRGKIRADHTTGALKQ